MKHPRRLRAALERFRRGIGEPEESREAVRHLLGGCPDCAQSLIPILRLHGNSGAGVPEEIEDGPDYSTAFGRVDHLVRMHQLRLAEERAAVPVLLQELERHPRGRQEVLATNSTRFHSWALVESLLERARNCAPRSPDEAEHLARVAVVVVGLLDARAYGAERIQDLRARAWGELGNVLRVQERYRESELAFAHATDLLSTGSEDPVEKAGLLNLEASLWRDRRQFERANQLLSRSIAIARRSGERQVLREALIRKAHCDIERGSPDVALSLLLQAQGLLDLGSDPRLAYVVQHNILFALIGARRYEEAAAGLEDTRKLCDRLDYPVDRIRLELLEGMVMQGLGHLRKAEACFRSALGGMLAEGLDYDAALVGLDLAALLSQQNRHAEVRELAAAMLPVFTSHRIHREAIAALLVFQEAVQREQLSAKLVEDLSAYLRNAASDPQLRFQPPAWLKSSKS